MQGPRYNDLTFDSDFVCARRDDGSEVRFTRERAVLVQFVAAEGQLLTRARLLEGLGGEEARFGERNIDFVINRLRAKLGDDARAPRFIATQYGEGYIWVARPWLQPDLSALLVVGPVFGMGDPAAARLGRLVQALRDRLGGEAAVSLAPDLSRILPPGDGYALEACFHDEKDVLHAAFVLRDRRRGSTVGAFRAAFRTDDAADIGPLAEDVAAAIWQHEAMPAEAVAPRDAPLEIRMHEVALMLARSPESWLESEAQVEKARAAAPGDPALAIMRGLALFARLILDTGNGDYLSPPEWSAIESEIEALALGALPAVGDNPLLMLGAAKLLFFIDRGHFALAERLAEDAFARSTAFAASFATLAPIRMCAGRFEEAVRLYDRAVELAEPGSEFAVYLMVMKCTALLAAGDRARLDEAAAALYAAKPVTRFQLGLALAEPHPAPLPPDLGALIARVDAGQARRMLLYVYRVSARHFRAPAHRANVLRGLASHLAHRFGPSVLPDEVAQALGQPAARSLRALPEDASVPAV